MLLHIYVFSNPAWEVLKDFCLITLALDSFCLFLSRTTDEIIPITPPPSEFAPKNRPSQKQISSSNPLIFRRIPHLKLTAGTWKSPKWKGKLSSKPFSFGCKMLVFSWDTVDGWNPAPVELGKYPIVYRVLYIPGGAGFRPSARIEALEGRARVLEGNAQQPQQRAVLQVPINWWVMGGMAELFAIFYPLKYAPCKVISITSRIRKKYFLTFWCFFFMSTFLGFLDIQFQHFLRCLTDKHNVCGDGNSWAFSGFTDFQWILRVGKKGSTWNLNNMYRNKNDSLKYILRYLKSSIPGENVLASPKNIVRRCLGVQIPPQKVFGRLGYVCFCVHVAFQFAYRSCQLFWPTHARWAPTTYKWSYNPCNRVKSTYL